MGMFSGLWDLLFPPRCAFCKRVLKTREKGMCAKCAAEISYTKNGGAQSGDFFKVCVSPLYYEDTVRDAILRFKFKDDTIYAKLFGVMLADCIQEHLKGSYDIITWVPLSKERRKKRGYDQAMLLAMAAALNMDDVAVELLYKTMDVPAQSTLGAAETRRANISGVYAVADEELVRDRRILIIDDIVTTGSTLSECAKTLKLSGAKDVVCCTLARARG